MAAQSSPRRFAETPKFQKSASVLYMSMSLDGFIAGPNDDGGDPGRNGLGRLHEWHGDFSRPSGPAGDLSDEWNAPGAVLAAGVLDELQINQIPVLFGSAVVHSRGCHRASGWTWFE
jgi:hypothetical protein